MPTINHRILYVGSSRLPVTGNSLATMLNNVIQLGPSGGENDPDFYRLAKWCAYNQITGIKWYLAGSTSLTTWQGWRFVIEKLRGAGTIYDGVKSHQLVFSGGWGNGTFPSTHDATRAPFGFNDTTNYDTWVDGPIPGIGSPIARWFTNDVTMGTGNYNDYKNTGYDLEYEFYNQTNPQTAFTDVWAPKMANGCYGLWNQENPAAPSNRLVNANTSYLGWWTTVPAAPALIVATHTRIDLHDYVSYPTTSTSSMFNYTRSRLNDLANAQATYAAGPTPLTVTTSTGRPVYGHINPKYAGPAGFSSWPQFEFYPIFSMEAANTDANGNINRLSPLLTNTSNFSGMLCSNETLPGVTPIVGLNLTFDQVFNCYLTGNKNGTGTAGGFKQWQLANTTGNANFIKEPDGYVLFSYLHAYYARPYEA